MSPITVLRGRPPRYGNAVAVLFIDLDEFKLVNDTLGHGAGDALLVAVAERLSGVVREADTLGRLGGDEFVVLAECPPAESGPGEIAARVTGAFTEPFAVERLPEPLRLSASIGVASSAAGSSAEQLLCDADIAMYSAKGQVGGCARYEPGMEQALVGRSLRWHDGPAGSAGDGAQGVGTTSTP